MMPGRNVYACIKLSLTDNFAILQKEALLDLWSIQGVIQINQRQKLLILGWKKKAHKKTQMVKVFSSSNMDKKFWLKRES